ncbi:MAG: hypothetical protein EA360_01645, partial [Balneolaceae bacterium]
MRQIRLFIGIILLLISGPVSAQEREPIRIARTTLSVTLDGISNEPAWEHATRLTMTMYEPFSGVEPSERTVALVMYDDDYLYFALRAYDSDPDGIRGNVLFRDRFGSDDYFEVMLDTFNDNE